MDNGEGADKGHQTDNAFGLSQLSPVTCQQRNYDVEALNKKHAT
jgi:hypothetical protein